MSMIVVVKYILISGVNLALILTVIRYYKAYLKIKVLIPFFMFCIFLLHAVAFSYNMSESIERLVFALLFILAFSLFVSISPRLVRRYVHNFLFYSGVLWIISCYIAIIAFPDIAYHSGNFKGFSNNSNYMALYLAVFVTPSFLFRLLKARQQKKSIFPYIFLILNLIYLLLETRSRASLGVMAVNLLLFLYFSGRYLSYGKPKINFKFIVALIAIPLFFFNTDFIMNKYGMDVESQIEGFFSTRAIMYEYRLQGIQEKPLTGWGYSVNSAEGRMIEPWVFNLYEKGTTPLAIIEELGLILGSLVIFFFVYLMFKSYSIWLQEPIIGSVVIGSIIHSLFETWLFNFNGYYCWIFWLCIIYILRMSGVNGNRKKYEQINWRLRLNSYLD